MRYGIFNTASAMLGTSALAMLAFVAPQSLRLHSESRSAEVRELRVVARDFALSLPSHTASGLRHIRLVNAGTEPHYLGLMRVDSGKTAADFLAWRSSRTARPAWLVAVGGAAPVQPGDSVDLALTLQPGRYVAFCTYPSPDGISHLAKGMFGELVVDTGAAPDAVPFADATLRLVDYAFTPPPRLAAGRRTVRVENAANQLHQMLVIRLPEGITPQQEIAWFRGGSRGARPGVPSGGVLQLPPREQVWVTMDLPAGRYLLLCTAVDERGRPHHESGMRSVIEVSSSSENRPTRVAIASSR